MKIVFATNNRHKLEEVRAVLGPGYELLTPQEVGVTEDIPEEQNTLEGNASQKSHYLYEKTGENCFADDTGLEVEALNGAPGVYSARYAGEEKNSAANMALLLENLKGVTNRNARFRTVISLILDGKEYIFEGEVKGHIVEELHGTGGFGYDPIFVPEGYMKTFAEMTPQEKNSMSHRGRAVEKLARFFRER